MQKFHSDDPAVGVTREEFIAFLRRAQEAFVGKMRDPANVQLWQEALGPVPTDPAERSRFEMGPMPEGGWPDFWSPIWSFDNPSIHGGPGGSSVLEALGISQADHFELPVRSSDIHKVIEHTHARLVIKFEEWYYYDPQQYELRAYKVVFERCFYDAACVASANVIMKDVLSIPRLAAKVVAERGGEVPKRFR